MLIRYLNRIKLASKVSSFNRIFKFLPYPAILISHDGHILSCNEHFLLLYAIKPSDVIDKNYFSLGLVNFVPAFTSQDLVLGSTATAVTNILNNNELRVFQWIATQFYDRKDLAYFCLQGVDITAIAQNLFTEKKLRSSIIDRLPNHFIFWKDQESRFLGCNEAFALSAGLASPADIVGKRDYDLPWSKAESEAYVADDQEVMKSKMPKLNIEESQTLRNGEQVKLSTSKFPLLDDQGNVYGVLAVYSDITQQKQNEQKLIETNSKLENAHRAKSEFIRNISHDIRTPLAGIQQTLGAIAEKRITEKQIDEFASAAYDASVKLMQLFNQIIDVSRHEDYEFEDKSEKFDLHELMKNLSETYRVVARHKNLAFDVVYAENFPRFLIGKHLRLHRILMNLLGNALKFTEKGKVVLNAELVDEQGKQVVLRFSVVDTGPGIPQDKLQTIFEPFTRLTPSFQGQYPGSGLGLHVVSEYIKKMQGEIYVNSTVGIGATFTCLVPFEKPILNNNTDLSTTAYPTQHPTADNVVPFTRHSEETGSHGRILLVEDDALARSMGALILKDLCKTLDVATSGEEAVQYASKHAYDLIFMDIGLPGMDGLEASRQIRAEQNHLNHVTPIVALTAHADKSIVDECPLAGICHVLLKPLTSEKAQKILHDVQQLKTTSMDVLDLTLWQQRLGKNAFMLDELFQMFVEELNGIRIELSHACQLNDFHAVRAIAHKLKGSLQYCGFPRLESAAKALELAAKQNDAAQVRQCHEQVTVCIHEVMEAYAGMLADCCRDK